MLKYTSILAVLICFAISCKKETITPPPVTPVDTVAVFTLADAAGNCNPITVQGIYVAGTAVTAANKIVLQANVATAGTYAIAISSGNGYGFTASGKFTGTGAQTITAQAAGTPANGAINTLSITVGGKTCSFDITVFSTVPVVYNDNDHMYFGNPSNAALNTDSINNYLMRKPYNAISYSKDRGTPNWVSWHLYAPDLGTTDRSDGFIPDNSLPFGWYQVTTASYSTSGFDRGHCTPSGDRTSTVEANGATFVMTNIIPQAPQHNQRTWASFEDSLRRLVTVQGYELYIIMGGYGAGGYGTSGLLEPLIDGGNVTVPASIWKIAVMIPNGDNDLTRVNNGTRVIAVDIPNRNDVLTNWKSYRTSVDAIEASTGLDLLKRLPEPLQSDLEARIDNL